MSTKGGSFNRAKREYIGPGNPQKTGDALGPGYYEADYDFMAKKQKKKGKGPKIPKARRGSHQIERGTPGPGQYYSGLELGHMNFVIGGIFGKAGRESGSMLGARKGKGPGPGQYGTLRGKKDRRGGGFSFGTEKRGKNGKDWVPGPGQYSKQKAKVNFFIFPL